MQIFGGRVRLAVCIHSLETLAGSKLICQDDQFALDLPTDSLDGPGASTLVAHDQLGLPVDPPFIDSWTILWDPHNTMAPLYNWSAIVDLNNCDEQLAIISNFQSMNNHLSDLLSQPSTTQALASFHDSSAYSSLTSPSTQSLAISSPPPPKSPQLSRNDSNHPDSTIPRPSFRSARFKTHACRALKSCTKSFARKSDRDRHERIHLKAKDTEFLCGSLGCKHSVPEGAFYRRDHLTAHLRAKRHVEAKTRKGKEVGTGMSGKGRVTEGGAEEEQGVGEQLRAEGERGQIAGREIEKPGLDIERLRLENERLKLKLEMARM